MNLVGLVAKRIELKAIFSRAVQVVTTEKCKKVNPKNLLLVGDENLDGESVVVVFGSVDKSILITYRRRLQKGDKALFMLDGNEVSFLQLNYYLNSPHNCEISANTSAAKAIENGKKLYNYLNSIKLEIK